MWACRQLTRHPCWSRGSLVDTSAKLWARVCAVCVGGGKMKREEEGGVKEVPPTRTPSQRTRVLSVPGEDSTALFCTYLSYMNGTADLSSDYSCCKCSVKNDSISRGLISCLRCLFCISCVGDLPALKKSSLSRTRPTLRKWAWLCRTRNNPLVWAASTGRQLTPLSFTPPHTHHSHRRERAPTKTVRSCDGGGRGIMWYKL